MLEFLAGFQDIALLFARLFLGIMFIAHGKGKMFGPNPGVNGFANYLSGLGFPLPKLMAFIGAVTEFWGGLFMIFGLFTRVVAVLMAVLIIVAAYVNIEKGKDFKGGWETDLLILALCLVLMTFGAGAYSLLAIF